MDREVLDLSGLDLSQDPERWNRLLGEIRERAAPELARRASSEDGIILLAFWARPIMKVAAAFVVAAVGTMTLAARAAETVPAGIPEAMGLPATVADWLVEERPPAAADLMLVLERERL